VVPPEGTSCGYGQPEKSAKIANQPGDAVSNLPDRHCPDAVFLRLTDRKCPNSKAHPIFR